MQTRVGEPRRPLRHPGQPSPRRPRPKPHRSTEPNRVMEWPEIAGDPRFFRRAGPHTLAAVADAAGGKAPPRRMMLRGVAPLQTATPEEVSFLDNRKYAQALEQTEAGAVI